MDYKNQRKRIDVITTVIVVMLIALAFLAGMSL